MKPVIILAVGILLVIAMAKSQFMGRSTAAGNVTNAIAPVAIPASLAQADEAGPEVKLILLALMPEGFDRREVQLEAGEYLFIVGNRTGLKEVNVRLDREGNERLAATALGGRQKDWKKRLKLTPGTYVVTANDNPDWTCRIVVGR